MLKILRGHSSPLTAVVRQRNGVTVRHWIERALRGPCIHQFRFVTQVAQSSDAQTWGRKITTKYSAFVVMVETDDEIVPYVVDYHATPEQHAQLVSNGVYALLTDDELTRLKKVVDCARGIAPLAWAEWDLAAHAAIEWLHADPLVASSLRAHVESVLRERFGPSTLISTTRLAAVREFVAGLGRRTAVSVKT